MPNASLSTVLAGVNSIGLFASRAFVSAFAVAAVLKWGPQIGWINNTGLLQRVKDVPSWFTHDVTLTILGLLAVLEITATKSADARALLNEIEGYIKSASAFVTTLAVSGIITHNDAAVLREITAFIEPVQAGFGDQAVGFIAACLSAVGVWFTCTARRGLIGLFLDADPDDDTMVLGLMSWAEDLWALLGTLLLIFFPLVMLALTVLILGVVALLRWCAIRREEKSKTPCAVCGESMYRSAVACPACKQPNAEIHAIGWLGQSLDTREQHPDAQPLRLTQKQRCPVCATHLQSGKACQVCPACGHELFKKGDEVSRYLAELDARVPVVLVLTGLFSLVPVVGIIPAILLYRLRLVAPLRRYTSAWRTVPTRWALRLLFFVLIWVQVIPVVGGLAIPIMAAISYGAYRRMFTGQLARERENDAGTIESDGCS